MTVYRKTQKGMSELLAQSPAIHQRLISVLLLVDGLRDSSEVISLGQQAGLPADGLDILFHGGFIEKKFKGSASPPEAAIEPPPAPLNARPVDAASKLKGFNALYAYLVGQTKALLGLRGFVFQLRIEQAMTAPALKSLIEPLADAIARKHGLEVSENFRRESQRLAAVAVAEQQA